MTQAQDIVQALIERASPRAPVERSTGMPYGWALWLRAMSPRPSEARAAPDEVAALLARRSPAPPLRGEELAAWPAFFSLFREGWLPAPRDERPMRWASRTGSLVLHLLFVAFLAWVAWMQSLHPPLPPEADGGGERVAIGFVGAGDPGTPEAATEGEPGDMPGESPTASSSPAAGQAAAVEAAAASAAARLPQGEIVAAQVLPPPSMPEEVVVREVPEPAEPQSAAEQPVQVTEVERPTIDYVLPPTTPPTVAVRAPTERPLREREVVVVEAPQVRVSQPRPVDVELRPREAEVRMRTREVDEPLPQVQVAPVAVRAPRVEARLPGAPESSVREREVGMPATPSPAAATATAADAVGGTKAPAPAAGSATAGDSGQGRVPGQARAPGDGSEASRPASAGGGQSPIRGDDWGQARSGEQRPGGAPGLFDGQGRVRLPGDGSGTAQGAGPGSGAGASGQGTAERGAPGGDGDRWSRERFEQSGTWLKRPPYDYEPTSFDRYWVPNESLLAEWVRKGRKTVAIPIPGTSKKINCVVSLLQLGGGCSIVDPNLNEQPAEGRPPPDVPFKPELQEDNGSVRPS